MNLPVNFRFQGEKDFYTLRDAVGHLIASDLTEDEAEEIKRAVNNHGPLVEALEMAIKEIEGLPHSLGYEFTHLPAMRAALTAAKE